MKKICSVFKSSKKDEMYLYVDKQEQLARVPDALKTMFGTPLHVFDMLITPEKKMARVEADKVLSDIQEKGFSCKCLRRKKITCWICMLTGRKPECADGC